MPIAYQCQCLVLCPLVTDEASSDLNSFSSSSAQSAQRHLPAQLTAFVYLQICNYLSLSAFHICLLPLALRSPSVFGLRLSVI